MNESNMNVFYKDFGITVKTFGCHALTAKEIVFVSTKGKMKLSNPALFSNSDILFKNCRFAKHISHVSLICHAQASIFLLS